MDRETRRVVGRIIQVAPRIATLEALARNLYLSRRALGHRLGLDQGYGVIDEINTRLARGEHP